LIELSATTLLVKFPRKQYDLIKFSSLTVILSDGLTFERTTLRGTPLATIETDRATLIVPSANARF